MERAHRKPAASLANRSIRAATYRLNSLRSCNKATARDPADRYADANAFRDALDLFLRHRNSTSLGAEAWERLRILEAEKEKTADTIDDQRLRDLFAECRFGFEQSLRIWKDNPQSQGGLKAALEIMVAYEVQQNDYRAAEKLMGELSDPPASLLKQVEELRQRDHERTQRLEQLEAKEKDYDLDVGKKTRIFMALISGVFTGSCYLIASAAVRAGWIANDNWIPTVIAASYMVLGLGLHRWARESLLKTKVNRKLTLSVWLLAIGFSAVIFTAHMQNLPLHSTMIHFGILTAGWAGACGVLIQNRLLWSALVFGIGTITMVFAKSWMFEITAVTVMVGTLTLGWLWQRPSHHQRGEADLSPRV
jgi:eukaryotic-like serine/threonine-protein kinase